MEKKFCVFILCAMVCFIIHFLIKPIPGFNFNVFKKYSSWTSEKFYSDFYKDALTYLNSSSDNWTNETFIDPAEWKYLMTETDWPKPAHFPTTTAMATDPAQCSCSVISPKAAYLVGDYVTVEVHAKDAKGMPKTYGGDFFQAKLYNTEQKASTFGEVTDHRNGTYTIHLALLWPGTATVSVRLIHSSEAVQVLARQRDQDPDKVYFLGHFKQKSLEETVQCNAQKSARLLGDGINCCCMFTDPVTGETWICRKPAKLPCSAWIEHSFGGYQAKLSQLESSLLCRLGH